VTTMADQEWRTKAACRGQDARWWFPEDSNTGRAGWRATAKRAISICVVDCPVRRQCLEFALEMDERWGVWGGHTAEERAHIQRRRAKQ
jgi:WhiB family redox-sensing transcriptional regulator